MSLSFYFDVHVPQAIAEGLRLRDVDVITTQEDSFDRAPDSMLLSRATVLGLALVSFDKHLLAEAHRCQEHGDSFSGVIYAHPMQATIGGCVRDLELLAKAGAPEDLRDQVVFLPL